MAVFLRMLVHVIDGVHGLAPHKDFCIGSLVIENDAVDVDSYVDCFYRGVFQQFYMFEEVGLFTPVLSKQRLNIVCGLEYAVFSVIQSYGNFGCLGETLGRASRLTDDSSKRHNVFASFVDLPLSRY